MQNDAAKNETKNTQIYFVNHTAHYKQSIYELHWQQH